jgi:hypothetical protein
VARRDSTLSTKPTPRGVHKIDLHHRFHGLQHLEKKPCLLMVEEAEAALRHSAVGLSVGGDGVEAARRQREEHAAEHNTNDVRCRGGFAELRQCLFLRILEAKKARLVTFSIDAPESSLPGAARPMGPLSRPL